MQSMITKLGYTLEKIYNQVYLVSHPSQYELGMFFLRYQEHYESPNPEFRDHTFTIVDYMSWYQEKFGKGVFTYPKDWTGFNIPSSVINNVISLGFTDSNKYDKEMMDISNNINEEKYYLIGSVNKDATFNHELSHAFYFLDPEFKDKMDQLTVNMDISIKEKFFEYLSSLGYCEKVLMDECQAFLATGIPRWLKKDYNLDTKPFKLIFNKKKKEMQNEH